jgi:hypothetical protein
LWPGQLSHSCIPSPVYYVPVSSATHLALLSDPESSAQALKPLHTLLPTLHHIVYLSIIRSTTATPATLLVSLKAPDGRRIWSVILRRLTPSSLESVVVPRTHIPAQQPKPAHHLTDGLHTRRHRRRPQACYRLHLGFQPVRRHHRSRRCTSHTPIAQQQGRRGPGLAQCSRPSFRRHILPPSNQRSALPASSQTQTPALDPSPSHPSAPFSALASLAVCTRRL